MKVVRGLSRQGIRESSGVVDQHVEAAMAFADGLDEPSHRVLVADVAGMELVRQTLDGVSCAGDHGGAFFGENRTDLCAYPSNAAGHQKLPPGQAQMDGIGSFRASHCASSPSKCLF